MFEYFKAFYKFQELNWNVHPLLSSYITFPILAFVHHDVSNLIQIHAVRTVVYGVFLISSCSDLPFKVIPRNDISYLVCSSQYFVILSYNPCFTY
jgi:hypothetical protein